MVWQNNCFINKKTMPAQLEIIYKGTSLNAGSSFSPEQRGGEIQHLLAGKGGSDIFKRRQRRCTSLV
jgi:hypothetical protein